MVVIISLFHGLISHHTISREIVVIHFPSLFRLRTPLKLQVKPALGLAKAPLVFDLSNLQAGADLARALEQFDEAYFADFYSSLWEDFSF